MGASTTATGGGANNSSAKPGAAATYSTTAGPVYGQAASWAQVGRPSAGAPENYALGRNSVIFKHSERKYKDNSRFCDLLSSSSNDSSKDDHNYNHRVEDEASNTSNNFNEMMIMDEDTRVRNNYTSSFLDHDLLRGGGQRRKHDSVIDKQ